MAKNRRIQKTNAARLLDRAGIAYTLVPYEVDEEHLDACHVAESLGENISHVYKTLVLHGSGVGMFVCVIPGDKELDLKKTAAAVGVRKVEMLHMRDLLPNTGYIRGGCSPIGMKQKLPTFIQRDCLGLKQIYISAGQRGLQLCLDPAALINYTGATPADIIVSER